MWKIDSVMKVLEDLAPLSLAVPGDAVGLIAGRPEKRVKRVLLTLDVTPEAIREAEKLKADLIVSHHNIYHGTVPRAVSNTYGGEMLLHLCEEKIGLICLHTNLDAANGGVNDMLAARVGLRGALGVLDTGTGLGRFGALEEPMQVKAFAAHCKKALNPGVVRFHDSGRHALLVAVCGGRGGDMIEAAFANGCDTLVTADVKHDEFLLARYLGFNILDCGHFATESVILKPLYDWIGVMMADLELYIFEKQTEPYLCL